MTELNPFQPAPPRLYERYGEILRTNGYHPVPVLPAEKRTFVRGWPRYCAVQPTAAEVARWGALPANYGLALACGYACVAIDLDEDDPERAARLSALAVSILGSTPLVRYGRRPRPLFMYRPAEPGMPSRRLGPTVEFLAHRRYFVAHGIHPVGSPYAWDGPEPGDIPAHRLPSIGAASVDAFAEAVRAEYSAPYPKCAAIGASATHTIARLPTAPGKSVGARRAPPDPRWALDADGRVCDGRDSYLAMIVCRIFCRGVIEVGAIADTAWSEFERTAALARPKRDAGAAWSHVDALAKAAAIVRKAERQPGVLRPSVPRPGFWTPPRLAAFRGVVDGLGARGHLSPATVLISHAMTGFVRGDGPCFASPGTLAALTGCTPRTAKAARRILLDAALWCVGDNRGGRARGADYVPNREALGMAEVAECDADLVERNSEQIVHPNLPVGVGNTTDDTAQAEPEKRREKKSVKSLGDRSVEAVSPGYRAGRRPRTVNGVAEVPLGDERGPRTGGPW